MICYPCQVGNHVACRGPGCQCDLCASIEEDALQDNLVDKEKEEESEN